MEGAVTNLAGVDEGTIAAIVSGEHGDPFAVLGIHEAPGGGALLVCAFLPGAGRVWVIDAHDGSVVGELPKLHEAGFFAGQLQDRRQPFHYRLRTAVGEGEIEFEDPYQIGRAS